MAVALSDYFTSLQYEINPPGSTIYTMTQGEMLQRLIDAFWELRIFGVDLLSAFSCDDNGNIAPIANANSAQAYLGFTIPSDWYTDDGGIDLGREVIQAIILTAGYRIALTNAQNLNTMVRSQAGNVSYEVQKSAQMQQTLLKNLMAKLDIVLTRLSDLGTTAVSVYDSIIEKTEAIRIEEEWWVR